MSIAQTDSIDAAGASVVIGSTTLQVAKWLGIFDFNSIVITITGILGIIYLIWKIKVTRIEYKEKKRNFDKDTKHQNQDKKSE